MGSLHFGGRMHGDFAKLDNRVIHNVPDFAEFDGHSLQRIEFFAIEKHRDHMSFCLSLRNDVSTVEIENLVFAASPFE